MDVHCSSCGEPWDVYHLRHDAIFETDLDHAEANTWRELSPALRLPGTNRGRPAPACPEISSLINRIAVLTCSCSCP